MHKLLIGHFFLQWELFALGELETFNRQMMRVYKKELEDLVMGYESYIQAIYRQLDKRKQEQQIASTS